MAMIARLRPSEGNDDSITMSVFFRKMSNVLTSNIIFISKLSIRIRRLSLRVHIVFFEFFSPNDIYAEPEWLSR